MAKQVPIWEKYNLTLEEASAYFQIGINKMRSIVDSNRHADYILWNGSRALIKRKMFEKQIDMLTAI